ncbi:hypothetical protein [Bacillus sp. Bva_UNVM-123]
MRKVQLSLPTFVKTFTNVGIPSYKYVREELLSFNDNGFSLTK